jgi:hypothetical protein
MGSALLNDEIKHQEIIDEIGLKARILKSQTKIDA